MAALILCVTAFALWAYRDATLTIGERHLENLAIVLDEMTAHAVRSVDLILIETTDDFRRLPAGGREAATAMLHQRVRERIGRLEQMRAFVVTDGAGNALVHSQGYPPPQVNYQDRDYFTAHRDRRTSGLHVGEPIQGRVIKERLHTLSRRIEGPAGEFLGVVAAAINISYFHDLYRSLTLGPAGRVLLFHRDGLLLTTYPVVPDAAGRSFSEHALFAKESRQAEAGVINGAGFLDFEPRVITYRFLRDFPIVVAVSSTRAHILGQWWRQFWQIGAGAVLAAVLSIFLGLWLARQLRAQEKLTGEVRASEQRWLAAMEAADHGVWDWDVSAGTTFRSPHYCGILGYAQHEITDTREEWLRLLHPDDRELMHGLNRKCVAGAMDSFSAEIRLRCKDGTWKWVLNRGQVVGRDGDGKARRMLGTITDVTEHRHTQQQLRDSEARLNGIIESAMDAIITIDERQNIVLYNAAAERIFGRSRAGMVGTSLEQLIPERFREAHRGHIDRFGATGVSMRHMGLMRPVLYGLRTGSEEFPIDASISQVVVGDRKFYTVILRDISERHKAQQALEQSHRELQDLYARMNEVREAERLRIARELHDELAQWLTALKMDVAWVAARLPQELEALVDRAGRMKDLVDTTVAGVRRIAADLRPVMLDDLGMVPAVENLLHEFSRRTGIVISFDVATDAVKFRDPLATAIYRMVQETLTNIARHAQASEVRVAIRADGGVLAVSVRDNGRGFDPSRQAGDKSFGLLGIRERAQTLGGSATISSAPGSGTLVTINVPLRLRSIMEGHA